MSTMAQAAEVYEPKPLQLWRALVNWLGFFVEIILQILRGAPCLPHFLSYLPLLASPPSSSFRPLPVAEIQLNDASSSNLENGVVSHHPALPKLTVVLDLDETLVCAYETSSVPAIVRTQATDAGLKWFEIECVSSDKSDGKPKISYVTVFERPGLHEFLKRVGEFADLVLFTAGLEGYARPLVDRIDLENRFKFRLYRPSTVTTENRDHVKDLSCISKDLCRIVIVDNNPFSFVLQPLNGVPCIPFSAGHPYDDQLLEVLLPLLKHLAQAKDVRPVLYERFHMPEWFQMHGITVTS
ncbi:uncharacterized protein LOC126799486 isoform X2 [Argentina anserina]|uniref:uncharacterized protein LOC126799486 isoform X2 n=1 Tax=Argentina anserina TaxID=57926 RepID=UPI0021765C3E|nr:uncharacterized protein LOC126799486 isoform X2 [Potentilla anserina]